MFTGKQASNDDDCFTYYSMPSTRGIQVALHRLACDVSESEAKNRAIEALQFMRIPATSNGFSSLARGQQKEGKAEILVERERGEQHFADVSKISNRDDISKVPIFSPGIAFTPQISSTKYQDGIVHRKEKENSGDWKVGLVLDGKESDEDLKHTKTAYDYAEFTFVPQSPAPAPKLHHLDDSIHHAGEEEMIHTIQPSLAHRDAPQEFESQGDTVGGHNVASDDGDDEAKLQMFFKLDTSDDDEKLKKYWVRIYAHVLLILFLDHKQICAHYLWAYMLDA